MKILSKPFAALATYWNNNDFFRARLKLTALYVIVTAVILVLFSAFLYYEVEDQLAEFALGNIDMQEEIDEDEDEIEPFTDAFISEFEDNIILANLLILVLVAVLGYWLAGRTLRPIEEKMRQQEQFSNDVAHEIRTPLSAMLARTESVLRKEETTEMYQKALAQFKDETARLITLTEDLLLTAGQNGSTNMQSVSLNAIANNVVDRLRPLALKKQLMFNVTAESEEVVIGNELLLERMLENIIHNAIKFTPPDGTVAVKLINKKVIVTDTGVGMNENGQQHAFDRFYSEDTARDERGLRGMGLGLSIVKQIAALHSAQVAIESREGAGTTVTVIFLQ